MTAFIGIPNSVGYFIRARQTSFCGTCCAPSTFRNVLIYIWTKSDDFNSLLVLVQSAADPEIGQAETSRFF